MGGRVWGAPGVRRARKLPWAPTAAPSTHIAATPHPPCAPAPAPPAPPLPHKPMYMAPEQFNGSRVDEKVGAGGSLPPRLCPPCCAAAAMRGGVPCARPGAAASPSPPPNCLPFNARRPACSTWAIQVDVYALGVILNECYTRHQPWRDSSHFFQIILKASSTSWGWRCWGAARGWRCWCLVPLRGAARRWALQGGAGLSRLSSDPRRRRAWARRRAGGHQRRAAVGRPRLPRGPAPPHHKVLAPGSTHAPILRRECVVGRGGRWRSRAGGAAVCLQRRLSSWAHPPLSLLPCCPYSNAAHGVYDPRRGAALGAAAEHGQRQRRPPAHARGRTQQRRARAAARQRAAQQCGVAAAATADGSARPIAANAAAAAQ